MYMTGEEQPSPLAKIKYMKPSSLISLLLLAPLAGLAQSTVFNDTFNSGSTFNVLLRSACVTPKSGAPVGFRQVRVAERWILASHPLPAAAMAC